MENTPRILIVDDNPLNLKILHSILTDYQVDEALDGEQCLSLITTNKPDIMLLDVNMPGMSGFEVCRRVKEQHGDTLPVIFVSAADSLDERLEGYQAGADDYITRPFDVQELSFKIKIALRTISEKHALEDEINDISSVCETALTASSEMGIITQFIQRSCYCSNFSQLAQEIFAAMESFGLHTALQIRHMSGIINANPEGHNKQLENQLLSSFKEKGRLIEFQQRLIVNFPGVSLLVRNMPVDDPEKQVRIKDLMVVLVSAANARVSAVCVEQRLKDAGNLTSVMESAWTTVENIQQMLKQDYKKIQHVMATMGEDIEEQFFSLALDEDQEQALMKTIDESSQKIFELLNNEERINSTFNVMLSSLENMIATQRTLTEQEQQEEEQPQQEQSGGSDVELF